MTYLFNIIDLNSLNHLDYLLDYVSLLSFLVNDIAARPIVSIGVVILIPLILLSSGKMMKEVLDAAAADNSDYRSWWSSNRGSYRKENYCNK